MAAEIVIHSRKKVIFTNLTQYELFQEESDLIKAGLYFSIPQDKIRKSEIFTTFEKIDHSFLNNLKSEETKSQIKAHPSHLANSYFYNCKLSPSILRQHRVLQNFRNAIEEVISDTSKLKTLVKTQPSNAKLHCNAFYVIYNEKTFLMKLNMINCILLSNLWYS